ncbi:MAG: HupE/UreJ family protein [Aquabacterium sp.]|uniref:HupE/UreJ family protein n=1 Tax=Aquabacterium sp. TaxID=1872578 RepID=UPI003BE4AE8F
MTSILNRRTVLTLAGTAAALASPLAMAHLGAEAGVHSHHADLLSSLAEGAIHPFTGLDHLAAMLSVGLWSTLSARSERMDRRTLSAPLAFAGTMLMGGVLGAMGIQTPAVEPMIAASLLVIGLLVATRLHLSTLLGAALMAMFALYHGLAHGAELSGHMGAALAGMVISTLMLHGTGMWIGQHLQQSQRTPAKWLARAAGAAVALLGGSLLMPAMATVL